MNTEKIFRYDSPTQKAVSWLIYAQKGFAEADSKEPGDLLQLFSPDFLGLCVYGAGKSISTANALFYLLLEHRRFMPSFYPPHDICLSLANLIKAGPDTGHLLVLDARLLPPAILLAGSGWEVALPKAAHPLKEMLVASFKDASFVELPEKPGNKVTVLAGDPRACLEEGRGNFLREAEMAVCLTNWDFLGVKTNESYRRYWMEKSGVSGILQLSRLKRQGSSSYPAILRISHDVPNLVRMARIGKVETGADALNQEELLSLMSNEPDGINSLDVARQAINANPACNLTPALWLKIKSLSSSDSSINLGKCFQIIRCQLKRAKIADNLDIRFGPQQDGSYIVKEVGMAALQAQCGILLDGFGETVSLEFKRRNSEYKYLLRKNDIIFAFRGTTESLGKVGFVDQDPRNPTITGTAFYLLRSLGEINPVWLFWYLQSGDVRNIILSRASGATMLNISVEDIGSLPIRMPREEELAKVLSLHSEMAQNTNAISSFMREIARSRKRMMSLIY